MAQPLRLLMLPFLLNNLGQVPIPEDVVCLIIQTIWVVKVVLDYLPIVNFVERGPFF